MAPPQTSGQTSEDVPIRTMARVLANRADGHGYKLRLEIEAWPGSTPGQFVMLGAGAEAGVPRRDPLLPRPMAVYRDLGIDVASDARGKSEQRAEIEILYRVVGRGTKLLEESRPDQTISIVGPLGNGFAVEGGRAPALLVGGGTGIASLYELAAALKRAGRPVSVLLGARAAADLIGRSDFEALELDLRVATEDGSRGARGLVTELLIERLDECQTSNAPRSVIYACGPTPMMRATAVLAKEAGSECFVSLENPMACGFGVCLGCAAPRQGGGFSLVCRHGPVFQASEIAWEAMP